MHPRTLAGLRRLDERNMPRRGVITRSGTVPDGRAGQKPVSNAPVASAVPCRVKAAASRTGGEQRTVVGDQIAVIAPWIVIVPIAIRVDDALVYTTQINSETTAVLVAIGDQLTVAADDDNPTARRFQVVLPIRETYASSLTLACKEI